MLRVRSYLEELFEFSERREPNLTRVENDLSQDDGLSSTFFTKFRVKYTRSVFCCTILLLWSMLDEATTNTLKLKLEKLLNLISTTASVSSNYKKADKNLLPVRDIRTTDDSIIVFACGLKNQDLNNLIMV